MKAQRKVLLFIPGGTGRGHRAFVGYCAFFEIFTALLIWLRGPAESLT
jgi:hypothetical protein